MSGRTSDYESNQNSDDSDYGIHYPYGDDASDEHSDEDVPVDVLLLRLEDSDCGVRCKALNELCNSEPATLAQHAKAVIAMLEDSSVFVRNTALTTLNALPLVVTRGVYLKSRDVRSRLLGRLAWYNYRIHVRVKRIALYWYALPYRPSGPGHTRDVEAWRRMQELRLS